ncbi:hypothetical protein LW139_15490 [Proteus vulgaris]|uniref:hypothetical protein n=1 Tax=Proteus vulgaris TaxID=585 RepID=UPI001FFF078C|nr:hypothetical protein [Proteus vulgaris]UPK80209.1 hypothetical protein LW139_15490 [Proteus vulgaris]
MGFNKITIDSVDHKIGYIGGGAYLENIADWPMDNNKRPMFPFISLEKNFFPTNAFPDHMMITVFLPLPKKNIFSINYFRDISLNLNIDNIDIKKLSAKVLIHRKGTNELIIPNEFALPKGFINLKSLSSDELKEEIEDEINGIEISKQFGRPAWLQDQININSRYHFITQINETDLKNFNKAYENIFNDGMGYIFLDYKIKNTNKTSNAGFFFIQYL